MTDAPVRQAARFEDYSPEYFAVTGSKGAAALHMLRWVAGDDKFKKILQGTFVDQSAGQERSTDDFRKVAEKISRPAAAGLLHPMAGDHRRAGVQDGVHGLPHAKGFRVMGKITQDLDTFRMPVDLKIETEGNPEAEAHRSGGHVLGVLGRHVRQAEAVTIDPNRRVLRNSPKMRVDVAIRRGEQFVEISDSARR